MLMFWTKKKSISVIISISSYSVTKYVFQFSQWIRLYKCISLRLTKQTKPASFGKKRQPKWWDEASGCVSGPPHETGRHNETDHRKPLRLFSVIDTATSIAQSTQTAGQPHPDTFHSNYVFETALNHTTKLPYPGQRKWPNKGKLLTQWLNSREHPPRKVVTFYTIWISL